MRYWPQIRLLLLVLFLLGLIAYALGFRLSVNARGGVDAFGGVWVAESAEWHETDGALRGTIVYAPERVELESASADEILASLCDATLADLEHVGQGERTAADIYRLDLNFTLLDGARALPFAPMIPVKDGACQFDLWEDGFFYPTYAGNMTGWFLLNAGATNSDELGVIPAFEFRPLPDANVGVMSFDFDVACAAILSDPAAWYAPGLETVDRDVLSITARGVGAISLYQRQVLNVTEDRCSERGG